MFGGLGNGFVKIERGKENESSWVRWVEAVWLDRHIVTVSSACFFFLRVYTYFSCTSSW